MLQTESRIQHSPQNVVKHLEERLAVADAAVMELTERFARGDAGQDEVAKLADSVAEIVAGLAIAHNRSDEVQAGVRRLVDLIRGAAARGTSWMENVAGPELDSIARGEQVRRAYRQAPRGFA